MGTEEDEENKHQEDDISKYEENISVQEDSRFRLVDLLATGQVNNLEIIDRKLQEDPINCEVHLDTSEELIQLEDQLKRYKDELSMKY